MSGELILLVDDEPHILQLARMYLEREGFRVEVVGDGNAALESTTKLNPDLIVLDLMLPELDGLEVCRQLRAAESPVAILMLTARDDDIDKILGLEMGADDYLTKPFNPRELVARVKAVLRRADRKVVIGSTKRILDDLIIDTGSREVTIHGSNVRLRSKEFDLLAMLVEHKGLVLTREKILDRVWGYEYFGETRTVDVHIGQLRKKIAASSVKIKTVIGVGYKLVE
jgi:DNA-binding response OmpR family regulator